MAWEQSIASLSGGSSTHLKYLLPMPPCFCRQAGIVCIQLKEGHGSQAFGLFNSWSGIWSRQDDFDLNACTILAVLLTPVLQSSATEWAGTTTFWWDSAIFRLTSHLLIGATWQLMLLHHHLNLLEAPISACTSYASETQSKGLCRAMCSLFTCCQQSKPAA